MKDAKHHLKHVQRKVIQAARKEELKKSPLNGKEQPMAAMMSVQEQSFVPRRS